MLTVIVSLSDVEIKGLLDLMARGSLRGFLQGMCKTCKMVCIRVSITDMHFGAETASTDASFTDYT